MKVWLRISLLIVSLLALLWFRSKIVSESVYVAQSEVQGEGLFANRSFQQDELILTDLFPGKDPDEILYKPISSDKFHKAMGYHASKLNHCSKQTNAYVTTDDHKLYQLYAYKPIQKDEEITVDYNLTHKHFPFIGTAQSNYETC